MDTPTDDAARSVAPTATLAPVPDGAVPDGAVPDGAAAHPAGRGRPRDEAREQAILDAALELLVEVGFDRMSIVAIAARAHASKATIYRRWPGKVELVVDAICRRAGETTMPPDTGDLRGDLLATLRQMVSAVTRGDAAVMPGIILAMRDSPELAAAMRSQVHDKKREVAVCVVDRALGRGERPASNAADLMHQVAPSMVFFRLLVTGEPLDEEFLTHMVDDVLVPLMTIRS